MRYFTITDQQIKDIHNAMCDMYQLNDAINEMFKPESTLVKRFNDVYKRLKPVRDQLMKVRDECDDNIRALADELAKQHKFKYTRWSIYDIYSLLDKSNIPAGALICAPYESSESVTVKGDTWLDLWKAVEELASKTKFNENEVGFGDHVFIEKFTKLRNDDTAYEVWLGS